MFQRIRRQGLEYGLSFSEPAVLSNSRKALLAGEFARDQGRFGPFHDLTFRAYFEEGKDIGRTDLLLDLAERAGLERESLRSALEEERHLDRLAAVTREAHEAGIHAAPTFVFEHGPVIVGAQPLEAFRDALRGFASMPSS